MGLDAPIQSVPPGYSLEVMVYTSDAGLNAGVKAFGSALLDYHNTTRIDDYATHWLGFSTDNGAYYYYNTAPGKFAPGPRQDYQDTLLGVHAYAQKEGIPYKHVLLDSWWCASWFSAVLLPLVQCWGDLVFGMYVLGLTNCR